jgi:hypothetical protein
MGLTDTPEIKTSKSTKNSKELNNNALLNLLND